MDARVIVQVRPGEQFAAERDLRKLIKERFDERGIEIPFPRRTGLRPQRPSRPSRPSLPVQDRARPPQRERQESD